MCLDLLDVQSVTDHRECTRGWLTHGDHALAAHTDMICLLSTSKATKVGVAVAVKFEIKKCQFENHKCVCNMADVTSKLDPVADSSTRIPPQRQLQGQPSRRAISLPAEGWELSKMRQQLRSSLR